MKKAHITCPYCHAPAQLRPASSIYGIHTKDRTAKLYSRIIEVQTHNTDLKKRLAAFAAKHPQCCRQTDDDEQGGLTFEIEKGRLSFAVQEAANSHVYERAANERSGDGRWKEL